MKCHDFIRNVVLLALLSLIVVSAWGAKVEPKAKQVLIVMDEKEQMDVLAAYMKEHGDVESTIVDQKNLPDKWDGYDAVIGFIHGKMAEETEVAFIDYTKKGGRYIAIHHMISSGKAKNKYYFDFLGIRLDGTSESRKPPKPGGHYGWVDPITLTLVNLNPNHFITSNNVKWDKKIKYAPSEEPTVEGDYPSLTLEHAEAYMNHKFTDGREKTVVAGFKFLDERSGQLFMQDRAIWTKPSGKGHIIYYKAGHSKLDFENVAYSQMILNGVLWKP